MDRKSNESELAMDGLETGEFSVESSASSIHCYHSFAALLAGIMDARESRKTGRVCWRGDGGLLKCDCGFPGQAGNPTDCLASSILCSIVGVVTKCRPLAVLRSRVRSLCRTCHPVNSS